MNARHFAIAAGILGFVAVLAGAVGSHVLEGRADEAALARWDIAARFNIYHALALLGLSASPWSRNRAGQFAGVAYIVGTALFCGSLYARALGAPPSAGSVAPFGGICLMAGWLGVAWAAWVAQRESS